MAKKDLANVTADLSALAAQLPTQRPSAPAPLPASEPPALRVVAARKPDDEEVTQYSFVLRKSLRKQLNRLASDADMTMRAFTLHALKEKGLDVRDEDLVDRRK